MEAQAYIEMHRKLKLARSPAQRAGVMNQYVRYPFTGAEAEPMLMARQHVVPKRTGRKSGQHLSNIHVPKRRKTLPVRGHSFEYYAHAPSCTVRAKAYSGRGTPLAKEHYWVETAPYTVIDPGCGEAAMTPAQYERALYEQRASRRAWCVARAEELNARTGETNLPLAFVHRTREGDGPGSIPFNGLRDRFMRGRGA